jgi:Zn-dependent protease
MFNKKEVAIVLIVAIVLAFTISVMKTKEEFSNIIVIVAIILMMNVFAKKIAAYYFDSEIEIKLWEIERFGFKPHHKLKRPFPAGVFVPILITFITLPLGAIFQIGHLKWMATLVFDVKTKIHRAVKRHGLYSFSEMTEYHIGLIAAAGIVVNLIAALIGYFLNQPEFAKLSIYFAFFNMLPLSDLDGNKIFFGSLILWSFLAIITLIGTLYAVMLI